MADNDKDLTPVEIPADGASASILPATGTKWRRGKFRTQWDEEFPVTVSSVEANTAAREANTAAMERLAAKLDEMRPCDYNGFVPEGDK